MAFSDRSYYSGDGGGGGLGGRRGGGVFGGGGAPKSFTVWLIIVNVVVFILNSILAGSSRGTSFSPEALGNLNIGQAVEGFQVWRFVTYQFLHGDFFHILFNMLILYFFGRYVEGHLGSKRFLAFYLICGCFAGLVFVVLGYVPGLLHVSKDTKLVGASGSVFGVLIAYAAMAPNQVVNLWGVIPMTMRTLAYGLLGIAVFSIVVGSGNAGGEAAHLGGAVMGFILIHNAKWLGFADRVNVNAVKPSVLKNKAKQSAWNKKLKSREDQEREVDRILAKVNAKGLHSLSSKEKKILQRETQDKRGG